MYASLKGLRLYPLFIVNTTLIDWHRIYSRLHWSIININQIKFRQYYFLLRFSTRRYLISIIRIKIQTIKIISSLYSSYILRRFWRKKNPYKWSYCKKVIHKRACPKFVGPKSHLRLLNAWYKILLANIGLIKGLSIRFVKNDDFMAR